MRRTAAPPPRPRGSGTNRERKDPDVARSHRLSRASPAGRVPLACSRGRGMPSMELERRSAAAATTWGGTSGEWAESSTVCVRAGFARAGASSPAPSPVRSASPATPGSSSLPPGCSLRSSAQAHGAGRTAARSLQETAPPPGSLSRRSPITPTRPCGAGACACPPPPTTRLSQTSGSAREAQPRLPPSPAAPRQTVRPHRPQPRHPRRPRRCIPTCPIVRTGAHP